MPNAHTRHPSLCPGCILGRCNGETVMLTGYTLPDMKCDCCGNRADLALCRVARSIEAKS